MADAFPPWKIFRTRIEQHRDFEMVYWLDRPNFDGTYLEFTIEF